MGWLEENLECHISVNTEESAEIKIKLKTIIAHEIMWKWDCGLLNTPQN